MTLMAGLGTNRAGRPGEGIEIAMRLAWATDIHLNFVTTMACRRFLESVKEQADALVVTGDIAESNSLGTTLIAMDALGAGRSTSSWAITTSIGARWRALARPATLRKSFLADENRHPLARRHDSGFNVRPTVMQISLALNLHACRATDIEDYWRPNGVVAASFMEISFAEGWTSLTPIYRPGPEWTFPGVRPAPWESHRPSLGPWRRFLGLAPRKNGMRGGPGP